MTIRILETRRNIDPNWEKQIEDLKNLLRLANGAKRLSKLLGVKESTIYAWCRYGRISPLGALLVESSSELGDFYNFVQLRPDQNMKDKDALSQTKEFKRSRKQQKSFECSVNFKKDSVIETFKRVKTINEET